jgi:DNA repair exonuclease SbcCD ATPase subunit
MIKSLQLINYQSYKNSLLEFDKGINVIIGSSKSGKTAILRDFRTISNNRPSGLSMNSYWNRDKKHQPIEEHSSIVTLEEGPKIARTRTKDFNGYIINDVDKLEAVGTDVPAKVSELLNFSEVNMQRQFDQPFLLSESPAEIARFFNKIIHLDLIDKVLSKAELTRKRTGQDIERDIQDIEKTQKEIEKFNWLEKAEEIIIRAERWENRIKKEEDKLNSIKVILDKIKSYQKIVDSINYDFDKITRLMNDIVIFDDELYEKESKLAKLTNIVKSLKQYKEDVYEIDKIDFKRINQLSEEITTLYDKISKKENRLDDLRFTVDDIKKNTLGFERAAKEIVELEKEMPESCPLCNQPLKGVII